MTRTRSTANARERELISIEKAAVMLDVSARSIRRWISRGVIDGYRVGPRSIRVDRDQVANLGSTIGPDTD